MNVYVEKVMKDDFDKIAEEVHYGCFNEYRPKEMNRFNYALLAHSQDQGLTAYATVLEHDAESAYMQHGGTFHPNSKMLTTKSYLEMVAWLKKHYPVITTRIFNWNIPMLKLALQAGFLIHGVEYYKESPNFKGGILLCLNLESEHFKGDQ